MKKKLIGFVLVLTLVLSMSTMAFATHDDNPYKPAVAPGQTLVINN